MTEPTYFSYLQDEIDTFLPENHGVELSGYVKDGIHFYTVAVFDHNNSTEHETHIAFPADAVESAYDPEQYLREILAYYLRPLRAKVIAAQKPDLATQLVTEFHETYNQPVRTTPTLDVPEKRLRLALIEEEVRELRDAILWDDLTEVYDALLDIIWVCHGALLTFGLPFREGIEEVARSNRSKLGEDGKPIYRESDGKVLKGPGFFPPDLKGIIDATQKTTGRG